jgi:hypothetical protein
MSSIPKREEDEQGEQTQDLKKKKTYLTIG